MSKADYVHKYLPLSEYHEIIKSRGEGKIISMKAVEVDRHYERGIHITQGIAKETCNAQDIVMGHTLVPPKSCNPRHFHLTTEAGMYIISGELTVFLGPDAEPNIAAPGDFLYVPVGCIHGIANASDTVPVELIATYGGVGSNDQQETYFIEESPDKPYPPVGWDKPA